MYETRVNLKHLFEDIRDGFESWHILLAVAWVLAGFVEQEKSPLELISQFFSAFAKERQATLFPWRNH